MKTRFIITSLLLVGAAQAANPGYVPLEGKDAADNARVKNAMSFLAAHLKTKLAPRENAQRERISLQPGQALLFDTMDGIPEDPIDRVQAYYARQLAERKAEAQKAAVKVQQ